MIAIDNRISTRSGDAGIGNGQLANAAGLDRLMSGGSALSRFQPASASYAVKAGDTLSAIAARHGTDWQTLARINGLADPDRLSIGQVLQLPDTRAAAHVHVVQRGETLSGIARGTGVSAAAIARANGLADPDLIHPGQRLVIGGGTGATAPAVQSSPARPAAPTARPAPAATGQLVPDAASVRAAGIAADRAAGHPSIGRCFAWVKTALQQSGAVPDYMPGVAAKGAGPALEQRGFVNLLDRPGHGIRSAYDAPVGAVLVYGAAAGATDRNAKYGHIEIRTDRGFASDYLSANARTGAASNGMEGRGRVLIGVYVKPAADAAPAGPAAPAGSTDAAYAAGNLSLGANEPFRAHILEAAERTGMAPQTIAAIIDAETLKDRNGTWLTNARASTSSATGMTQFLRGTWIAEATRPGSILNTEAKALGLVDAHDRVVDRTALLDARNDPRLSILAGADHARANIASLTRQGLVAADASPAALAKYAYLAHHEGLAGARGFLTGDMSYLREGTFEANVPRSTRQDYLDAARGDKPLAYRNWLSDYADRRIDVTRFMTDRGNVEVPSTRSLGR